MGAIELFNVLVQEGGGIPLFLVTQDGMPAPNWDVIANVCTQVFAIDPQTQPSPVPLIRGVQTSPNIAGMTPLPGGPAAQAGGLLPPLGLGVGGLSQEQLAAY